MRILAACSPGEVRIAVERDAALADYVIWRPGAPDGIGDVFSGVVQTCAPAMGGAFVTLPGERSGFLPTREMLTEGMRVVVRVSRAAQGGKGVRLMRLDEPPGDALALLRRGPSPLERLAEQYPDAEIVVDAAAVIATLPRVLRPRIVRSAAAFDAATDAEVEALGAPDVMLPGGVRATIEPTKALVAIDLDWSDDTGRGGAQAQFAANAAALPVLAAQIRLRNLSGAILIDPAGLGTRKRQALATPMRAALADDPLSPECLGATALGLLEIVRPRVRPPLHEMLHSPHGIGLDALRRILREHTARNGTGAPTFRAAPSVVRALEADPDTLAAFATEYGAPLRLLPDPDCSMSRWSFAP
ncbi:ribonuclease E/G [Tanticharoenia sakaeratensis]|uniref:S1 motif domain-containing protein n=1 Tax=Tanticharoenia sakaeratensis NBRC 103193 TaxID=1231623 RepID=A0A0D6MP63_9PROT|nr:ribonuclease E/G [Tanticharoenia sakaeratensis]GAN55477.1 hypothetical protein Tasa_048_102 [Tanticharoenia sakaeratensis NBRC 103193]GBQ21966.1 hypothetical protein AA103193_1909 [Tanticharoenia sakaeratensis NBRC 103193]